MKFHEPPFSELLVPFSEIVSQIKDWSLASPCAGWSAGDVVDHVINTQRDFLANNGVQLAAPASESPAQKWAEHVAALGAVTDEVRATEYDGWFGRTTIGETLDQFYGFDLIVHRWDLASSNWLPSGLTEAELNEIDAAADAFGDNLYAPGVCQPALPVAEDASHEAKVLARLGRSA